jgi:succinate dehydrogenase / fumarate reductase cytochrome b subunit
MGIPAAATAAPPARPAVLSIRGLHAVTGVVPLALFTVGHTAGTGLTAGDAAEFDRGVDGWYAIPGQPWFSWVVVLLPLAFHGLLGMILAFEDPATAPPSPWGPRWRRAVAWSGAGALAFVALHLADFRFLPREEVLPSLGASPHALVADRLAAAPWVPVAYAAGVAATVLHVAAGSWGFLVRFGIVRSPGARRATAAACAVAGGALLAVALLGLARFAEAGR